jgi:starch synthase
MSKKKAPLKVLMAFSEVVPFAKTGGLADVGGALPRALSELGCDVRVVMPLYNRFVEEVTADDPIIEDLPVPFGSQIIEADIHSGKLSENVSVYFIRRDEFFDRTYLYGTSKADYIDNAQRFIYFCRAILALCQFAKFQPDVVHCHDWQCGLVPAHLKLVHSNDAYWAKTISVFTIHNIAYQGQFSAELFPLTGLPDDFLSVDGMEFWGEMNLLKAGIVSADVVTTVSPKYSREIQTQEYGQGLDGVLRGQRHKLHGIINGADYKEWNPETDPHIAAKYSRDHLDGKRICKLDLLRTVGLPERLMTRPVLGMISRLADQKGLDLLTTIMERLLAEDLGLVILGVGEEKYHALLTEEAERNPERIAVRLKFDEPLAHKIEAGADMFLMPSLYEPCGLNQMYSLRYGTVPIVRATGGLYDSISPFDSKRGKGVGFRFTKYEPEPFWQAIKRAVKCFYKSETWQQIMKNGMQEDFSWKSSARQYLELYKEALERKQAGLSKQQAASSVPRRGDAKTRRRGKEPVGSR